MPDQSFDLVVIGGGIVGLSVAMEMTRRFPRLRLLLLEKETKLAQHQTGHNSGVIHSGIYYKPGSIKARTCVAGAAAMIAFCQSHDIPHQVCGKVIVANSDEESSRLEELRKRGEANGIPGLRFITREELREIEPHCVAKRALHIPGTGITDYALVSAKYAELILAQGGEIRTGSRVVGIHAGQEIIVETTSGPFAARFLVNCAGLYSDEICRMAGNHSGLQIIPFRGEYYDLIPERQHLVRALIYPTPDPRFPFLGVHFTRRIHGNVDAGPNAVFAFKREGYRTGDFSLRDTLESLLFPGFWRVAAKHWKSGKDEMRRAVSKASFVAGLQRLVPEIQAADLVPGGSGVRAQAITRAGALVDDFQFSQSPRMLHLYNVPSPAATASIAIGQAVVEMAAKSWGWR